MMGMRTWTVVTNALAPAGRREAAALAARGKDLVLIAKERASLEVVAAELRVVHGVDVRILPIALEEPGAGDEAVRWLNARDRAVDGIIAVSSGDAHEQRNIERVIGALQPEMRRRGFSAVRHLEADGGERISVMPPAIVPRVRRTTQPGYGDPARLVSI